jgi:predicted 2-oxoglutarate/Fe(II)-dependent dioxygenase YbiX
LFVAWDFLDPSTRSSILSQVRAREWAPALVGGVGPDDAEQSNRQTLRTRIPKPERTWVKERFAALMPRLESHFEVPLAGFEEPQLLRYREGDYFGPHRDSTADPEGDEYARQRRISVTLFLNPPSPQPAECPGASPSAYQGGSLVFYGLIRDPRAKEHGFPLVGEPGMLVAFRSDLPHEVKPVTAGERFTIVSWFF